MIMKLISSFHFYCTAEILSCTRRYKIEKGLYTLKANLPRTKTPVQRIFPAISKRIAMREHQVLVVVICLGFTWNQTAGGAWCITDAKHKVIVTVRACWVTAVAIQKQAVWVCKGAKQERHVTTWARDDFDLARKWDKTSTCGKLWDAIETPGIRCNIVYNQLQLVTGACCTCSSSLSKASNSSGPLVF